MSTHDEFNEGDSARYRYKMKNKELGTRQGNLFFDIIRNRNLHRDFLYFFNVYF